MNELVNEKQEATYRWGSKEVELSNRELQYFFEELNNLDIYDLKDLDFELQEIADLVIKGAPDDSLVHSLRKKLNLLRLIYNTLYASISIEK